MIRGLLLFVAFSAVICEENFNRSLASGARLKRQLADVDCGVPYELGGFISGGDQIRRGSFPW
jgi:hypothetical protein